MTTLKTNMEIILTINGVSKTYSADYDTLHNNDWNEIVRDLLDSNLSHEQGHDKD